MLFVESAVLNTTGPYLNATMLLLSGMVYAVTFIGIWYVISSPALTSAITKYPFFSSAFTFLPLTVITASPAIQSGFLSFRSVPSATCPPSAADTCNVILSSFGIFAICFNFRLCVSSFSSEE